MFDTLSERLNGAIQRVSGRGRITEDNVRSTVRQIRMALLEADVALPVVKSLVEHVRERALGAEVARSLNPGQAFVKIVHDELVVALGREQSTIESRGWPTVVLLVGLQGAGKTTTAGKLAVRFKKNGGQALLVSTDVYRPAAREQLAKIAADVGVDYYATEESDPRKIAAAALAEAKRRGSRWLIVDTAGRLHVDEPMMDEVKAIHAAVEPGETLFIVDSMAGQDAVSSARAFNEALPLTGVILTKADGDARGGAALSVREVTGVPIKLVGVGEKLDALEPFVPQRFASRILGMGDVVGLVERVQEQVDQEAALRVARKVKKGRELNLEDYREQLQQLINMGGLGSLLDKLPGVKPGALAAAGVDDSQLRRQMALIDSMTPRERRRPDLIDGSRKRRIAGGAGLSIQEINRLLKQHRQLAKTMKRASKGGMERALAGAMRGRGGAFGRPGR
ncbi:MAG TPA: signal recognition particle protein [Gammaproteobacteria bacterium]|nr:signal recognition particle protein [Gammaproteobacteria bacterium]